ncbi:MAG: NPCBM/NEW2 domain-containing protein, partial [Planctomycetota bacterium]
PVGFDRSAAPDGGVLTIHGKPYAHGIGMVPPATARWLLGKRFVTFRAEVGLERTDTPFESRRKAERVAFEVWGRHEGGSDARLLAASRELGSGDAPEPLEADVSGLDEIELRAVPTSTQIWHVGAVAWGDASLDPAE